MKTLNAYDGSDGAEAALEVVSPRTNPMRQNQRLAAN